MIHVTIDTREQTPWHFDPSEVNASRGTLPTGDYALVGDPGFSIERKSTEDYVGSIGANWDRFNREIQRMSAWTTKIIIVEGPCLDFVYHQSGDAMFAPVHRHYRITPGFFIKRTTQLIFDGVNVLFAGNADVACAFATAILKERQKRLDQIMKGVAQENDEQQKT